MRMRKLGVDRGRRSTECFMMRSSMPYWQLHLPISIFTVNAQHRMRDGGLWGLGPGWAGGQGEGLQCTVQLPCGRSRTNDSVWRHHYECSISATVLIIIWCKHASVCLTFSAAERFPCKGFSYVLEVNLFCVFTVAWGYQLWGTLPDSSDAAQNKEGEWESCWEAREARYVHLQQVCRASSQPTSTSSPKSFIITETTEKTKSVRATSYVHTPEREWDRASWQV